MVSVAFLFAVCSCFHVHSGWTSILPSRPVEILLGVLSTRLELSEAPGNVTILWTELELASSTYMWLRFRVKLFTGGVLNLRVLTMKLNRLWVCLGAKLSSLSTVLRTVVLRTCTLLLLVLQLLTMKLHAQSLVVSGLVPTPLMLSLAGSANGRRLVVQVPCLLL